MYTYTKGKVGEIDKIREAADQAFRPVRNEAFTFLNVMPKIYKMPNNEKIHHLYKDGEEIIAVAGNLIVPYFVNEHIYYPSFIGSVAVLPRYQKHGLMRKLMAKVEEENKSNKVPFSFLTGQRNRYEYFGYYNTGMNYRFEFVKGNFVHNELCRKDNSIIVERMNSSDLEAIYAIYKSNNKLIIRDKDNFVYSLINHGSIIYKVLQNEKMIGYFCINKEFNEVLEIELLDNSQLLNTLWTILNINNPKQLFVDVLGHNHKVISLLLDYAESYVVNKDLFVKVYDYKQFLAFAFDLNHDKTFMDGKLILSIDDVNVKIEVKNNKAIINYTEEQGIKLSKKAFLDLFSLDYYIKGYRVNSWFPLPIAVFDADKF